jgi:hypothetical protein
MTPIAHANETRRALQAAHIQHQGGVDRESLPRVEKLVSEEVAKALESVAARAAAGEYVPAEGVLFRLGSQELAKGVRFHRIPVSESPLDPTLYAAMQLATHELSELGYSAKVYPEPTSDGKPATSYTLQVSLPPDEAGYGRATGVGEPYAVPARAGSHR